MKRWTVEEKGPNVHFIRVPVKRINGWTFDVLLRADAHHDNPDCDRKMEYRHLEEAKDRGAPVLDFGDLFCAMQGVHDRRSAKEKLRPEHKGNNYLDRLVQTTADDYEPYAKQFAVLAEGNHETGVRKHTETCLTSRLVAELNHRGASCFKTGYSGWIKFLFDSNKARRSVNLWFIHGYGGGGPVTRGVIQSARRAAYVDNADIVVSGHIHEYWDLAIPRISLTEKGRVVKREQLHVSLPTYKDEYGSGEGGWHVERGGPPKPLGAAWLRFTYKRDGLVSYKIIRAD